MTKEKHDLNLVRAPLPVAVAAGMPLVQIDGEPDGTIVGFTQSHCIYQLRRSSSLAVVRWRDVAVGNVCPVNSLLPADTAENDRRNWSAAMLRELLGLSPFGLTSTQIAVQDELLQDLCGGAAADTDRN